MNLFFFLFLHLMEKNFKVKDTLVLEEAVLKGQMDSHGVFFTILNNLNPMH